MASPTRNATITRFVHHDHNRLSACARIAPRVAQLQHSFPLLFSMLASQYGPAAQREEAIRATVNGAPLKSVAAILQVPLALRHVPPEACPRSLHNHTWTKDAGRHLRPFIPEEPEKIRCWLEAVFFAARLGGEDIGLWFARQTEPYKFNEAPLRLLFPIILYAWISQHQPKLLGTAMPWTSATSANTAVNRCQHWTGYLFDAAAMGAFGIADPWIPKTFIDDHIILPLTTIEAISEEAAAWRNCLRDYVYLVADGTCRLFSIRKQDQRVAVIEVTRNPQTNTLMIAQIAPMQEHEFPLYDAVRAIVERTPAKPQKPRPPLAFVCKIHLDILLRSYRAFIPASEQDWVREVTTGRLARDISTLARWLRNSDRDYRFEACMRAQRHLASTAPVQR